MAKITKCFNYGNLHIHRCLKLFRGNMFLPKQQVFPLLQHVMT